MNPYRRKTIEAWKAQALILLALIVGIILGALMNQRVYASEPLVSPQPDGLTIQLTPTPTPTPTVIPIPKPATAAIEDAFAGFGPAVVAHAKLVAFCESSLRSGVVNENKDGSKDRGLFQINDRYWQLDRPFNPEANARFAAQLYRKQGWTPWLASQDCWGEK